MNCRTCLKNISPFLDGELRPRLSADMKAHFDTCQACRHELHLARKTELLLDSSPGLDPVPDFADRVLESVDRLGNSTPRVLPVPARHWKLAAALAACLLLAISVNFFLPDRASDAPAPDTLVAELDVLAELDFLSDLEVLENLDSLEAFAEIDELEAFLGDIDDALDNGS